MNENIAVIKLKNGIDLVSEIAQSHDDYLELNNPLMIISRSIPGLLYPVISFKHYMLFSEDGVSIPIQKKDIVFKLPARSAFAKFYKMSVHSDRLKQQLDETFAELTDEGMPDELMTETEVKERTTAIHQGILERFDVTNERLN